MTDRLELARAFEEAGIARDKAEHVASVVLDAIHENVATKADIAGLKAELKADIAGLKGDNAGLRAELKADIAGLRAELKGDIARLDAKVELIEHRLLTRLGGLIVVIVSLLFAALHYWPPHG